MIIIDAQRCPIPSNSTTPAQPSAEVQLIESLGVIRAYMQHFQFEASLRTISRCVSGSSRPRASRKRSTSGKSMSSRASYCSTRARLARPIPGTRFVAGHTLRRGSTDSRPWRITLRHSTPRGASFELHGSPTGSFLAAASERDPPGPVYQIFGQPGLDDILRRTIGVGAQTLYRIGLGLDGIYLERFALYYPTSVWSGNHQPGSREFSPLFLTGRGSSGKGGVHEINENYPYVPNPLRSTRSSALISAGGSARGPDPTFLFWRFTEGIYYDSWTSRVWTMPTGRRSSATWGRSSAARARGFR